jgi:Ca-activated chloride channel family protein
VLLVRDSTLKFIDALLPEDRARICTFGDEIAISPILTGDKSILTRIAREELWPGGATPLWGAMYAAMESLAKEPGRRVVLVLTDGINDGSLPGRKKDFGEVRDRAIKEGFMLYAVYMQGYQQDDGAKRKFLTLIDDTGGGHFQMGPEDDLQSTFVRIADELRRQYLIGFTPGPPDGREHKLEVKVNGAGLTVRARTSYVAVRQ